MSWLDKFFTAYSTVAIAGSALPQQPTLNFVSGVTGADNPSLKRTDLTVTGGGGGGGGVTVTGVDAAGADNAHVYVGSISGFGNVGGTIPVNATLLQFAAAQTAAGIGQAAAGASQTPANLVLAPQAPNAGATSGHQTPGSLVVALAAPVGSGTNAGLIVTEGSTALFAVGNIAGIASTSFLWLGTSAPSPTSSNYAIAVDNGNDLLLNAPGSAGTVNFGLGVAGNVQLTLGTSNTTGNFIIYGGNTGWNIASYQPNYIEWTPNPAGVYQFAVGEVPTTTRYFSALNPNLDITTTQIPSGSGVTYFGNAIANPASAPAGGALLYASGGELFVYQSNGTNFQISPGGGGGTVSGVDVAGADNAHVYVVSISGASGGGGVVEVGTSLHTVQLQFPSGANQTMIEAGTQPLLSFDLSNNLLLDGFNNVQILANGGGLATFSGVTQPGLWLASALSSFLVGWYSNATTSANGANLIAQPQFSTNGNPTGGNFVVQLQQATGSGSEAFFEVLHGGTYNGAFAQTFSVGLVPGSSGTATGVWGLNTTPGTSNYGLGLTTTRAILNAPSGGGFSAMAVAGTNILAVTSSLINPQVSAMAWSSNVSTPTISQSGQSSDVATQNFVHTAQNAFAGAATNVNGGTLLLGGGQSANPTITGLRGGVRILLADDTTAPTTMIEARELALGQRVVALCAAGHGVTTTNMPTNAGDLVIFIANANSVPSANAVGGGILYVSGGALKYRGSSGTVTPIASA